jgi:DNA primase
MNVKEQLKDIPIGQVADGLGLNLKKHGVNLQGDCPSGHGSEHHRCFSINLEGNYFHCFHCGAGGDVISLVELSRGLGFVPAMQWLAGHYRPDLLPRLDRARPEARPGRREYLTEERGYLIDHLKETDWIYWPPEKEIRAYLRNLRPEAGEQIKALKLTGYFGDNFRLAFPYRDRRRAITGYLKRATTPQGMIVKTYDDQTHAGVRWDSTPALDKHDLFGLHKCRGLEELVVVEGYPDALYLPAMGLKHVVAELTWRASTPSE